ncbi:hypothetical protein ACG2F4_12415 [Halalkalibaculum sp. DA3122]|uniref:hypothetical protein n=1 Tax=unclassified Halalkalibaculum TaxID=2964617 RepID=UPI0037546805
MAYFLIGFGIGTLMISGIKHYEGSHWKHFPTKFITATGFGCIVTGMALLLY